MSGYISSTNFAESGVPGNSTNNIEWSPYSEYDSNKKSYMILDNKNNLRMSSNTTSLKELTEELYNDKRLNDIEKCVVAYQMFTFVGNDLYDENIKNYPGNCSRNVAEQFIKQNASSIDY